MRGLVPALALLLGLAAPALYADQFRAVVLAYDGIADNGRAISADGFRRQMQYLRDHRYRVLPLPEVVTRLRNGQSLPDNAVAITFNAARRSICDTAFPFMTRLQMPFTVFVDADAVDAGDPAQCSWEQLQQLAAAGETLGNATAGNAHLIKRLPGETTAVWAARVQANISDNAARIEAHTGQISHLLAWPFGESNAAVRQLASTAGYTAFGTQPGPIGRGSNWLDLPRFEIYEKTGNFAMLSARLESLPLPIATVRKPDNPLPPGTMPTLEVVLLPNTDDHALRRMRLQCFDSRGLRISAKWLSETRFRVRAYRPLPPGDSLYSCSMPANGNQFYWYSVTWVTAGKGWAD